MRYATFAGDKAAFSSEEASVHRICTLPEKGWERLWLWATERVNPIVVKEIRQSLKSRQFAVCFGLTLIAAVGWTLLAISLMVPRVYYTPGGVPLLAGYFCILLVPLMIIIPFSAFRSLTLETEDSTFELLSISALSARQIVLGKMLSACLQIVLYLSALAPCIVLTYLMRGVSLFSILYLLSLTLVFSVCETALALLAASISRARMLQAGATVLLLIGLIAGFFSWSSLIIAGAISEIGSMPLAVFISTTAAFATILSVALDLVLRTAAAAIDFPSENHSTPIRRRLVLLMAVILFWSTFAVVASTEEEIAVVFLVMAFIVCSFIGTLMTGERGIISPRARRTLPKTFGGRVLLTWFYPGAGMGYIFIVCLFAALWGTMSLTEIYYSLSLQLRMGRSSLVYVGYLMVCYLAIYVGINRLLMLSVGRHMPARMLGAFALMAVIGMVLHLVPWVSVFLMNDYREYPYDWHQAMNIFWTCTEAFDGMTGPLEFSMVMLTILAISVFGLNLILCTRDVMVVRVAEPPRVLAETKVVTPVAKDPFAE
jgi:hypothetical protein